MVNEQTLRWIGDSFGFHVLDCRAVQGGWSALAYRLETDHGPYFLKAYDKTRPTLAEWIRRIDGYMPVLLWLGGREELRGAISCPVLTELGEYKLEDERFIYLVDAYIEGETVCEERLTGTQIAELAQILAMLHQIGSLCPNIPSSMREDFDIAFCGQLLWWMRDDTLPQDVRRALEPYRDKVDVKTGQLHELARMLRQEPPPFVLCHTDVHGWNLMQAGRLILIDWEGLRLAPAEADLFAFSRNFFYDEEGAAFGNAYRALRPEYAENAAAMEFYRVRRRLEDIHAFVEGLLSDGLEGEEREKSLWHIGKEFALL